MYEVQSTPRIPSRSRRRLLTNALALPVGYGLASAAPLAFAQSDGAMDNPNAIKHGFTMGDLTVTTLLAGTRTADNPQQIFGMNVSAEDFAEVSGQNFIPVDKNQFFFTPTVVQAGDETILFDTGLNAAGITKALEAAGISADSVSKVVITHMHGDHIGGLMNDAGEPTFSNAEYVTGAVEYDAWKSRDNENFQKKVMPLAEKMSFIGDGDSVASGISAMAAFGHTPGHMIYRIESGSKQLVIAADTANHYVWSLAYPEWEVKFDMDKSAAAQTRKNVFGMLAADRIPFVGYHMPFPALGYVEARGSDGFRYVASSYQQMLG